MASSSSPLSSSSVSSSTSSSSPPASTSNINHVHVYQQRKPSRNFPGLVRRSHMGSLASIVTSRSNSPRSALMAAPPGSSSRRRPASLHIPLTQTRSASSAMVSPILSAATRAINNNDFSHLEVLPYPPLIFPAAEFAPGNHKPQGRSTKGTRVVKFTIFTVAPATPYIMNMDQCLLHLLVLYIYFMENFACFSKM